MIVTIAIVMILLVMVLTLILKINNTIDKQTNEQIDNKRMATHTTTIN